LTGGFFEMSCSRTGARKLPEETDESRKNKNCVFVTQFLSTQTFCKSTFVGLGQRAQARGANAQALLLAVYSHLAIAEVRQKASRCSLFRKADRSAILRAFAAKFTSLGHVRLILSLNPSTGNKKAPRIRQVSS
jgi:hypothetical protein